MLLTIESKFNIGDNVHVPKGECKVLGVKEDSINPFGALFRRLKKKS